MRLVTVYGRVYTHNQYGRFTLELSCFDSDRSLFVVCPLSSVTTMTNTHRFLSGDEGGSDQDLDLQLLF